MSISGQVNLNIGAQNQQIGSDSLFIAFNKVQNNFTTLFSQASTYDTFIGSTGIGAVSNTVSKTVTLTNQGVLSLNPGTGITLSGSNGNVTVSVSGNVTGELVAGVTSVGMTSNTLTVTDSPIVGAGNIGVDLPIQNAYAAGTYSIYFNAVCCWNDDDQLLNNRQVLVATAPKHMFLTSPGSDYNDFTDEKRRVINDCIKNAVLTCSRFGLNISCISYSHVNGLYSDNIHPSSFQSAMFAYNIKSIATTL